MAGAPSVSRDFPLVKTCKTSLLFSLLFFQSLLVTILLLPFAATEEPLILGYGEGCFRNRA